MNFHQKCISTELVQHYQVVQAVSAGFEAGNFAKIIIDNKPVKLPKNENGHHRGLHLVVMNSSNGQVEFCKVFDTFKSSSALEEFL